MVDISAKKYMISNALSSIVRIGASSLATLVLTPFIIKEIGLDKYGYVSMTAFFISFASIFDLGLSKSLVFLLNDKCITNLDRNKIILSQKLINRTICFLIIIIGLLSVVFGLRILGNSLPKEDPHYYIVTLTSIFVLSLSIYNQYQSALLESYFCLNYVNHGLTIKIMCLNVLYMINLFTYNSIPMYVLSSLISTLLATAYYANIISKKIVYQSAIFDFTVFKKVVRIAFSFFKIGILTSVYSSLSRLAVIYLTNELNVIAILDVITKITLSVINLCSSILRPLYSLARNDANKVRKKLVHITAIMVVLGLSFLGVVVLFNPFIVNYFFHVSEANKESIAHALIIFSLGSMFFMTSQPYTMYLMGIGKYQVLVFLYVINILSFIGYYLAFNVWCGTSVLISLGMANLIVSFIFLCLLVYKSFQKV